MTAVQQGKTSGSERREHILECAATFFSTKGYDATSLGDIAEASGIAKATLFHYFKTKQAILFELYDQALRFAQERITAVDDPYEDPEIVLHRMVREHALLIMEEQQLYRLFFSEDSSLDEETQRAVADRQTDYLKQVARPVKQLQDAGKVANRVNPLVAVQIMLGAGSFTFKWFDASRPAPTTEVAELIAELTVQGLLSLA